MNALQPAVDVDDPLAWDREVPPAFGIQVAPDGRTLWVFSSDGSTIGRFSKSFGMDVHTTVGAQLSGARECLHCTHEPAGPEEWGRFRAKMAEHFGVELDEQLPRFP